MCRMQCHQTLCRIMNQTEISIIIDYCMKMGNNYDNAIEGVKTLHILKELHIYSLPMTMIQKRFQIFNHRILRSDCCLICPLLQEDDRYIFCSCFCGGGTYSQVDALQVYLNTSFSIWLEVQFSSMCKHPLCRH